LLPWAADPDEDPREPYSWDVAEIGMVLGHITQLNSQRRHKKKNPIGFAPGPEVEGAGSFPDVPKFDIKRER